MLATGRNSWAASACSTAISAAFNTAPIAAGGVIWFNSAVSVSGLHSNPATVRFDNVVITFTAAGTTYTLNVPPATVVVSPTATTATTTFDSTAGRWVTAAPSGLLGNVFLTGLAFPVPTDLPGGISPVSWSGDFSSDSPGVAIQWQWAAAVYTMFSNDNASLGVKPVDDNKVSSYQNRDRAGTPENFKSAVTSGARGNGGSNFTGSSSDHVVVSGCPLCTDVADCDDGDPCTTDTCDATAGCLHMPSPVCTTTTFVPTTTSSTITTSTTFAPATSTTVIGGTTTTTSTTAVTQQPITTTTSTATPTTQPSQGPVCGTCEHRTDSGLIDFEDPACCAESTLLGVRALTLRPPKTHAHGNRMRIDAIYSPAVPPLFDPRTEDTSVQIRDDSGELVCAVLPASQWERPHPLLYRFRDRQGATSGGLTQARFEVNRDGHLVFHASGRVPLRSTDGAAVLVTLRVGNSCAHSTLDLRSRRQGLVFP